MERGRKRVFYYSFEELYDVAENPKSKLGILAKAGILAVVLLEYYGFEPMLAFTVVNNAPQGASRIIFHEGNEENAIFQVLEQHYEDYNNYYVAVEKTIEEIDMEIGEIGGLEDIEEKVIDVIAIIVYDGTNIGIAIGFPIS